MRRCQAEAGNERTTGAAKTPGFDPGAMLEVLRVCLGRTASVHTANPQT
jgi:hypothetical protein